MKTILLNKGFSAIVDDEDFEFLSRFRWLVNINRRGYVYAVGQVDGVRNWMHRLLCGERGLVVDHINGNTLDNRRSNLRSVTAAQNAANHHAASRSNTGIKNISCRKRDGKFVAMSSAGGTGRVYLGVFETVELAKAALSEYEAAKRSGDTIPELLARIAFLEAENAALMMKAAA